MNHHINAVHENTTNHECDVCNAKFTWRELLLRHQIEIHDNRQLKQFSCSECGQSYKRQDYLKLHISTVHGEKNIKCDFCGMEFTHKQNLVDHEKNIHQERTKKKCEQCKKHFFCIKSH